MREVLYVFAYFNKCFLFVCLLDIFGLFNIPYTLQLKTLFYTSFLVTIVTPCADDIIMWSIDQTETNVWSEMGGLTD